jgi:3-deoxy-manno-octulosonate cytidylyltransferase (CMP-KDO synthetase)
LSDFWVVIPARRASSRLPGKPLADIGGAPMVVRVAQQAQRSGASQVVVATDCTEIQSACQAHGVQAMITRPDHASGTDRIAEIAKALAAHRDQIIVNVQGDEPLMEPALIAAVAQSLASHPDASVSTAAVPIGDSESLRSPHVVKVVCDARGLALYFSRAPIPYHRDAWPALDKVWAQPDRGSHMLRHVGIYGFRRQALDAFVSWPACELESVEQLEQLRWLWNGHRIAVAVSDHAPHPGVDTPEDLDRVRRIWEKMYAGSAGGSL